MCTNWKADSYARTVIFDYEENDFRVDSVGDYVEAWEARHQGSGPSIA